MPYAKVPCPKCGRPKSAEAELCRACKPTYERSPEHRRKLSKSLAGKAKPWLRGKKRPGHAKWMRDWWTPERRKEMSDRQLAQNPLARYHGLSCRGAKAVRQALSRCEKCGHDGSESRLDAHHRNGNKRDQSLANLVVLCHRCHMQLHSLQGDLRRNSPRD